MTAFPKADALLATQHKQSDTNPSSVSDVTSPVRVNLGARAYDIQLRVGCHAEVGACIAELREPVTSVVLIANRQVDGYYGAGIRAGLEQAGLPHHTLLVPAGERYKSLDTASRLFGDLIQRKVDRKALIIALGGGVIGDLAGFVAATYQRGVRFIQAPTSLLAQVDSSIGGKVGVNHPLGKNMIGAFLQPQAVFIDPGVLQTLPLRELRTGLAEVIKHGVIRDEHYFSYLEKHSDDIMRLDLPVMLQVIRRSCEIKALVVEEDEQESGVRAILNYGHTIAHAVETSTNYETYTHGEAVALGMVVAARIACAVGLLPAEALQRIIGLLARFALPTLLPRLEPTTLIRLMDTDKKAVGGNVRFVLPTAIGHVDIVGHLPEEILQQAIVDSMEQ